MTLRDGVLLVSNSEVQAFKQCRRKWMLSWYRGLSDIETKMSGPLKTGSRVHEALEGFYVPDGETPENPVTALRRCHERDAALLGSEPSAALDDFRKAMDLETAMVSGYMQWLEEEGADSYLKIVSSEQVLTVPFDVPGVPVPVMLTGKLDVRAIRTNNGQRVFLDHKTSASFDRFEQTAQQQEQPLHYTLLEQLSAPDGETQFTTGILYNLIRKVKRTNTAKPPFYKRLPINHNQREINAYADKLTYVIRDIWQLTERLEAHASATYAAYPSPSDSCTWKCDFFKVCNLFDDGSRYEDMLSQNYTKRDPLSHYESKGSE